MDNLIMDKDMKWKCLFPCFKRGDKLSRTDSAMVSPLTHPEIVFFLWKGAARFHCGKLLPLPVTKFVKQKQS